MPKGLYAIVAGFHLHTAKVGEAEKLVEAIATLDTSCR
jgi:metal-dependent hydrolase (beta-lactamase superfamily II)